MKLDLRFLGVVTALGISLAGFPVVAADKAALAEEGKGLIKQFASQLQAELKSAIKAKGAPHAIGVCNEKAPEIASQVSASSGWSVGRSSHKLRNPDNKPDDFTAAALLEFLGRIENGEKPKDLAIAEIVEEDGNQVFHLVKAIPTGEVCLNCHGGGSVKQPVVDRLAELYPQDKARNFKVGDMRGVFTLKKVLE